MNLLNLRPIAHTVHNLNNDYDLRVPQKFQHIALLGIVIIAASAIWAVAGTSSYSTVGVLIGIVLVLPAVITRVVTGSLLNRRMMVRDGIVDHAALRGDEQVLDVGVGSGITLFGCAKKLTTGKGIGIDIYDPNSGGGTADIFWKNARKEGLVDKVELKNMDARIMSFADQSFDVVVSTFAYHHIGNEEARRKASQEIVRVLKPGGKVLVYDAAFALRELEQVMREAGFNVHRHGDRFSMVMGVKLA
jgi:arsenite methyltransferase